MVKKRGNNEGSISHRKDGRWEARYTIHTVEGPKRKVLYGKTRADVAAKLTKAMADRDSGIIFDSGGTNVGDYLDRWMNDVVRGTVRESTYSRDKYLVTNHIKPALGRLKLTNLNALHLQGFYRDRLDSGLSGSTVQKMHHVLHKALAQAVKWYLIPRSPADSVKAPRPTAKEMHPLSAAEARLLLTTAQGDRLEALYELAIQTGMRQGELLGLKWEDVDLDRQTVRVRWTLTRKGSDTGGSYGFGAPKTKMSRRTVRLTGRTVDALRGHRARQAKEKLRVGALYQDRGLVFAGERGGIINPSNLRNRSFKPLLAKADLPSITFHDLRHTCASLLFQRNIHPKFVQELLGHASVAITLDTYSHMLPGMGGEAADAMDEALG
jgi:integrase